MDENKNIFLIFKYKQIFINYLKLILIVKVIVKEVNLVNLLKRKEF